MSYRLGSNDIRRPTEFQEVNSTQMAQHRTLSGSVRRDYFGSNKRIWILSYRNVSPDEYDTIKNIYDSYLSTNTAKNWRVTETTYTVSQTQVHVDLQERGFSVKGTSYLSDFDLILTEA